MNAAAATPLRRAIVLGLLAAALALVAVRSVARRESAIDARIGPIASVVVVARDVPAGRTLRPADLAYRSIPLRWAAPRTVTAAEDAVGLRTVVALGRGTPLLQGVLTSTSQQASAALASGDRVLELVAAGSTRLVRPGARVDVVAASADPGGASVPRTRVVAEAVEVLEVRNAESDGGEPRVSVTLRVARAEALRLTAADGGDTELRLLPRAAWDRGALAAGR